MRKSKLTILLLLQLIGSLSCEKGKDIDTIKPFIYNDFEGSFPLNCDTLYFGEATNLSVRFTDNVELGSFSISIHHNFDHHSHSTELAACLLYPKKDPVNPFSFIDDHDLPPGLQEHEANMLISIPASNGNELFDEGDYHFFISLTDKEGWSAQKGISIKMHHR
jgi:hypothetical protein